jgi:hypothetical protein
MILQISDDFKIVSDANEWTTYKLVEGKTKEGKKKKSWVAMGHYMTFAGAIIGLTNYRIRTIEGSVIDQIKAAIYRIESESMKTILDFRKETP